MMVAFLMLFIMMRVAVSLTFWMVVATALMTATALSKMEMSLTLMQDPHLNHVKYQPTRCGDQHLLTLDLSWMLYSIDSFND